MSNTTYTLRPISNKDLGFLRDLYATTREPELAVTDWSEDQKQAFIDMQFKAQHDHYKKNYSNATFNLVLHNKKPIGRLYVDRGEQDIRIVDVTIIPEERGKGIGTQIISELFNEGNQTGKPVSIHVENYNPARRLYNRLGFKHITDNGVYHLMEWMPENIQREIDTSGKTV